MLEPDDDTQSLPESPAWLALVDALRRQLPLELNKNGKIEVRR